MSADRRRIPVQDLGDADLLDRVREAMRRRGVNLLALCDEIGVRDDHTRQVLAGNRMCGDWVRRLLVCWVGRT